MKRFYYTNAAGQWVGPLAEGELGHLYQYGSLSRDTPVKEEGSEEALPYSAHPFAEPSLRLPPPGHHAPPAAAPPTPWPQRLALGCLRYIAMALLMVAIGLAVRFLLLAYLQQHYAEQLRDIREKLNQLQVPLR